MEAFSLLKYWRGGGGMNGGSGGGDLGKAAGTTTIVAAVSPNTVDTDDDGDDDGPFFDLEFAVPDEEEDVEGGDETQNRKQEETNCGNESEEEEDEDEREFNFTLSSGSSNDRVDPNPSMSPSDDLFFKGRLVPIEPSSLVCCTSEPNSKQTQLFPASLLKSATKLRVSMLGLKKSKPTANAAQKTESNGPVAAAPKPKQQKQQQQEAQQKQEQPQGKSFTVKFKVEEVPIVSLFTRDSSRSASGNSKAQNQQTGVEESASDEKRFSKDVMHKYLKKVKPLYVRVSRRYGEKLRFSGQLSLGTGTKAASSVSTSAHKPPLVKPATEKTQAEPDVSDQALANNVKIGQKLRVVCKHLGKSRSASSAAVAAVPTGPIASRRRDDSLLQQQDGIQGAILHCKRSFNASRDSESSLLSRSASDPSPEK